MVRRTNNASGTPVEGTPPTWIEERGDELRWRLRDATAARGASEAERRRYGASLPLSPGHGTTSPPSLSDAPRPRAVPTVTAALSLVHGRRRLDHLWWGKALQSKAEALATLFAIDLVSLTVTEHAMALAVVTRPDRAERWSEADVSARVAALRVARNVFAGGAPARVTTTGRWFGRPPDDREVNEASSIARARHRLSDEAAFREELVRWVSMRHRLRTGEADVARPIFAAPVVRARSVRLNDPAMIAAVGLLAIECSVMRRAWLASIASESAPAPPGLTLVDLGASRRFAELLREFTHAAVSPRSTRPVMAGVRALLGDEQFNRQQRLAVAALEGWRAANGRGLSC